MSASAPERMLDPICELIVTVSDARAKGLKVAREPVAGPGSCEAAEGTTAP